MDIVLLYLGLWTCAIFLACLGYGKAFLKILRVSGVDWGLESASGLSLLVLAGGGLNLAHSISRLSLTILMVPGIVLFAWPAWSSKDFSAVSRFTRAARAGKHPTIVWSLLGFIVLLMTVRIVSQLRPVFVDLNDDRQAYLAIEHKQIRMLSFPWMGVYAGLKLAEAIRASIGFRSDSVLSLVNQNPALDFSPLDRLGIAPQPFRLGVA